MRPQILFSLFADVDGLKGVGPRMLPLIQKLAGPRVKDLLFFLPTGLVARQHMTAADAVEGQVGIFDVVVDRVIKPSRPGVPLKVRSRDDTGFVHLIWFGGTADYVARQLPAGERRVVAGKVERFNGEVQVVHPDVFKPDEVASLELAEPIYPATQGLSSRQIGKLIKQILEDVPDLPEWQDPSWIQARRWPDWRSSLISAHRPSTELELDSEAPSRRRLAYDELLAHQLALARRRQARQGLAAPVIAPGLASQALQRALPFELTGDQAVAVLEIRQDLASGQQMARLLQGDVGSGKTAVAALALADVGGAGFQAAFMAPTEILARQHYERLTPLLNAVGLSTLLLTGRDSAAVRRANLLALASGEVQIAIGTHALFQDAVQFRRLALAVIDEQHRFGVNERRRLQSKGDPALGSIHLLSMSATPIPRTLELTQFGELDVSRLREKPPGRQPVTTALVPLARLSEVATRLKVAVSAGAQAYWICPLVEENEASDLAAATARAKELQSLLGIDVGLVHGQMPGAERELSMAAFARGDLAVLVATTVIEVGVDVPNATIMVIEHAERFGLAQLHQLRGRVGRGADASSCILLYGAGETGTLGTTTRERLETLRRTEDGFEIAETDFRLRGGGDPVGLRQSGFPAYRFADPIRHRDLMLAAADDARLVLLRDPGLESSRGAALKVLEALFDWKAERTEAD